MLPPFNLIIPITSYSLLGSFNSWHVDYTLLFSLHYHGMILLHDLHIASKGGELPIDKEITHRDCVFK